MSSSIDFVCLNTTTSTIKQMADNELFVAASEDDYVRPMDSRSVITRASIYNQSNDRNGERGIDLPGVIVTYLGMSGGVSHGNICHDNRVVRILVQIIDSTDGPDASNLETYFYWRRLIREWLQANPYDQHTGNTGQVYLVHVTDEPLPEKERWVMDRQAQLHLLVNCHCQLVRSKEQTPWQP